ncbi:adipocyte plasma membrane-associated protein Hemomucin-like [Uranotaenia lowii]|uniref:adipocyte plasma membrane-associated protein Hemomucin-like n=1 Tax=Uranotaenia lowii TaxID=190385 RepID=UPI002479DDD9|nr:adipocyte plasma membrane-associated protein Hemomucin-like [Uranotaenia lowii]
MTSKLAKVILVSYVIIHTVDGHFCNTTFPFKPFKIPPQLDLDYFYPPNQLLNKPEKLLQDIASQPEAILVRGNSVFVSAFGGRILEISKNFQKIRVLAKFGTECRGTFAERECGRPLGMAFDTLGDNLIVVEPYFGIWLINIPSGHRKLLVSLDLVIGGKVARRARSPNGVTVAQNGDIFWTDTSSDFVIEDGLKILLSNPSGRLIHYSRFTEKNLVLMDGLFGANGVTLSTDEGFVLVAELGGQMIRRFYLKGPKAGTADVFMKGLPGGVDNIVGDVDGVWVPIVFPTDRQYPSIWAALAPQANYRSNLVREMCVMEAPVEALYKATGSALALRATNFIGNMAIVQSLISPRGVLLRVDWEGNILTVLYSDDQVVNRISHATLMGNQLLLGSPVHPFIGRVKLPDEVMKIVAPSKFKGYWVLP